MIEKFATGSLASFGRETNVDLNNKYIVLDMTEMTENLKPIGMFMALDFVWDKAKESRIQKKVIFLDELWYGYRGFYQKQHRLTSARHR